MKAVELKYPTKHKDFIVEIQQVGKEIVAEVFSQPKSGYMVVVWWGNKAIDATYNLDKKEAVALANRTVINYKDKETMQYGL